MNKCDLCKKEFRNMQDIHNAEPLAKKCCGMCNWKVIKARLNGR